MIPGASTLSASRRPHFFVRPLTLAALASALVACGGGGGGGGGTPPPAVAPQSIAGAVIDGYVSGATVSCIAGGNVIATTTSDGSGAYAFDLAEGQTCDTIASQGGIDVGATPNDPWDDRIAPPGVFRSPVPTGNTSVAGLVVSPVTTLVQALVAGGATPDAAQAQVRTALGLPGSLDLLGTDPVGDPALYKATAVVGQLIEQIGDALAAAGGIADAAGRQALADAAVDAIAAQLPTLNMAALAPDADTLTPGSPLFGLVSAAATNAKSSSASGVRAALQSLDTTTFAAITTPLVAAAASNVNAGGDVSDIVARVNHASDEARASTVVASLRDVLDQPAGDPQTVLNEVGTALAAADAGNADVPFTVTVGGTSASAIIPSGLSNYARLRDDQVTFNGPAGAATATIAEMENPGVSVSQELTSISFTLETSVGNTQLSSTPIVVPLAMQVVDDERTFQAIIDRVALTVDGSGRVLANVPSGAQLSVYGKTATSETTTPLTIALSATGRTIVSTSGGTITFSFDRLFDAIGPAASGALALLAQNRVSGGDYTVTMKIGTLRLARGTSATDPSPALADLGTVSLGAGDQSVSGYGFTGTVSVTP
ncbi:MAG: hypothetical protein WCY32_05925 [Burkholderiaceae bacterium]